MKMKKVFCTVLALLMMLSLAACGGESSSDETEGGGESTGTGSADTLVIAYASGPSVLDPVMIPGDNSIWTISSMRQNSWRYTSRPARRTGRVRRGTGRQLRRIPGRWQSF